MTEAQEVLNLSGLWVPLLVQQIDRKWRNSGACDSNSCKRDSMEKSKKVDDSFPLKQLLIESEHITDSSCRNCRDKQFIMCFRMPWFSKHFLAVASGLSLAMLFPNPFLEGVNLYKRGLLLAGYLSCIYN